MTLSPSPYPVRFTALATAFAKRHSSLEETETRVRSEIAGLRLANLGNLVFHCIEVDDETDLIASPDGEGGLLVDTASAEEDEMLHDGVFAGRRMSIPRADSDR